MDFCCEHKSVQDFIAELLDKVRHAEHADVAVDADHGLKGNEGVKKNRPFTKASKIKLKTLFWSGKIRI